MEDIRTGTPLHLWFVGLLSLLWNGFGAFDYVMTRTQRAAWIDQVMPGTDGKAFMAYIDNFPIWASLGWGLGVWGALAGSILLLMRNRLAVPVFGVSLAGAVLGIGYQLMNPVDIPAMAEGANAIVPYVVLLIALGLFVYSRAMRMRGVLR